MDAVRRYFRSPAAVAGLVLLLIVIAMAISAGFLYPRDPLALAGRPLIWPFSNPRFLLGTDNSGRDIAAQIFYLWHKGDRKHVEAHQDIAPKYEWAGSSRASE